MIYKFFSCSPNILRGLSRRQIDRKCCLWLNCIKLMNLTEGIFNELSEKSYETFVKKYSLASVLNQENRTLSIEQVGPFMVSLQYPVPIIAGCSLILLSIAFKQCKCNTFYLHSHQQSVRVTFCQSSRSKFVTDLIKISILYCLSQAIFKGWRKSQIKRTS